MVVTESNALEREVSTAAGKVGQEFAPQVVRIGHSLRQDFIGDPAVFFRILLRDEFASGEHLRELSQRLAIALMNAAKTEQNGLHAYFNFRSISEQNRLQDPEWD